MINLENLNRQHVTITSEISFIEQEISKGIDVMNITEIALHINKLAGQLKIHLLEEDKFLYPNLLKNDNREIQDLANQYISEMGNLANAFTEYKNAFNISSKIKDNLSIFIKDTKNTLDALKFRIAKEDNQLYRFIAEKNI